MRNKNAMKIIDEYAVYSPEDYRKQKTDWTLMGIVLFAGIITGYILSALLFS